ncbi:MAG: penicillin-binding protein 2 [Deltaproteobacteria bacterium]|nr:penicillin-binding protein 2 [Deltaproteobacteria bacterium]
MKTFRDELVEYKTQFKWFILIISLFFAVITGRFFYLQIIKGEEFERLSTINYIGKDRILPRRGLIKDRFGEVLARNIDTYNLTAIPHYVKEPDREVAALSNMLELGSGEAMEILFKVIENRKGENRFNKIVLKKNLVSTYCPYDKTGLLFDQQTKKMFCTECGRRFIDERAVILSHLHELPGFNVEASLTRYYPPGELTAHVTGYMNEVNKEDLGKTGDEYLSGDLTGRTGIEKYFEKILRGLTGEEMFVKDARGARINPAFLPEPFISMKAVEAIEGKPVTLTLDFMLQAAAAEAIRNYKSGAVVVLEANTGRILAMYSKPSFNPNFLFSPGETKNDNPIYSPKMNKSLVSYPPGSTYKIVTALAGLMDGYITPKTVFTCPGFYEFKGRKFKCYNRGGHGKVDLIEAISQSCDVYFYKLGEIIGIDRLAGYAADYFGFGAHTGIELKESVGRIPTKDWHDKHSIGGFQPGFSLNSAVGQGDVKVTPLQLARGYAAFVNGGKLFKTKIVEKVGDDSPSGNHFIPEVEREISIPEEFMEPLLSGLFKAVNDKDGTAFESRIKEIPFAGKTGTAEAKEFRKDADQSVRDWLLLDHAWFVGYAPAKNPEIVVVVFIEHGGTGGKISAPATRKIIEYYYANRIDFLELEEEDFSEVTE